jgi:hypothetical protein
MSCRPAFVDSAFPACLPLDVTVLFLLTEFVFITLHGLSTSGALRPLWFFFTILYIIFFIFFIFFYCAVGGQFSLYSFSQLKLIIPLSSAPDKSLNCKSPPSMTTFTLYGPNQCIMSFPEC